MRFADTAVIVTNPEVSSVRDSDRVMGLLDPKTEKAEKGRRVEKHILITRYDAQWAVPRRDAQYRRRPGAPEPLHAAPRHHSGERGDAVRLQYRGTGHAQARTRTRRRPGKFAARFPAALDDFVQYATSQCPRGGPAYVDTADPERHSAWPRGCALLSRYATSPFHTVKQEPATALSPSLEHTL